MLPLYNNTADGNSPWLPISEARFRMGGMSEIAEEAAAKRRKNAAHGTSGGVSAGMTSPEGAQEKLPSAPDVVPFAPAQSILQPNLPIRTL